MLICSNPSSHRSKGLVITPWKSKEGDDDSVSMKSSASADSRDVPVPEQGACNVVSMGTSKGDGTSARGTKGAKGEKARKGESKKSGNKTVRALAEIERGRI